MRGRRSDHATTSPRLATILVSSYRIIESYIEVVCSTTRQLATTSYHYHDTMISMDITYSVKPVNFYLACVQRRCWGPRYLGTHALLNWLIVNNM